VLSLFLYLSKGGKNMQQYQYDGPVMRFDDCVQHHWKATTVAPTEAKAKSNLAYRYKKENGLMPNTKITLPGKLIPA
jgi:hypothetical protein